MNLLNHFLGRYRGHDEAVIVTCYFNPQGSPPRLTAFRRFHASIRHLPHRIVEAVLPGQNPKTTLRRTLGNQAELETVEVQNLLWHKESLLNIAIRKLPQKFRFVFWVDGDVLFSNHDWLTASVEQMQRGLRVLQPFSYCVHLEQGQTNTHHNAVTIAQLEAAEARKPKTARRIWRSFCANVGRGDSSAQSNDYDIHGHVGFAWGATRGLLDAMERETGAPLYDRALVGGADHIMAHAAAGQLNSPCIAKSFTESLKEIEVWSRVFAREVSGQVGAIPGTLYHLWHGDVEKRNYLQRIRDFDRLSRNIRARDDRGLYQLDRNDPFHQQAQNYVADYYTHREQSSPDGLLLISALATAVAGAELLSHAQHSHQHHDASGTNPSEPPQLPTNLDSLPGQIDGLESPPPSNDASITDLPSPTFS